MSSSDEIRKIMRLVESTLFEAPADDWLKANGWTETHGIALWTKDGDDRWIIDTNADGVVMVHDEVAGYGEPAEYCDTAEEAVAYIDRQNEISPTGEVFGVYTQAEGYDPEGNLVYLTPSGTEWVKGQAGAGYWTKKEAQAKADEINDKNGNPVTGRAETFDKRWKS